MKSGNRLKHGAKSYRVFHGGDSLVDEEETFEFMPLHAKGLF